MKRIALILFAGLLALLLAFESAGSALAQQQQASQEERIQRLEEQLMDLNSMIATLQSLVSQGGVASPGGMAPPQVPMAQPEMSGGSDQRIDALETQIRALTGQLEQMGQQIAQLQASMGNGQMHPQQGMEQPGLRGSMPDQQQGFTQQDQGNTFGQTSIQPNDGYQQQAYQQPQQPYDNQQPSYSGQQPAYGAGQQDSYGSMPSQQQPASPWAQGFGQDQPQVAALPSGDSQSVYETAYNHLLKRDFGTAEQGFREFLQQYPNDPLAGNAQYWLGETYYVRGQFREAADSFLAGYRNYGNSDKAPANLLKLGMSLYRLGEEQAACSTFSELESKYPNAPSHLKQRAAAERERSGC